jgi:3-hydroxyisobutyrate dehydrogenase-like beta-hydroxyacid dehydrogenase
MTGPFIVGLLHPGEMGAAVGRCLTSTGHEVLWASQGRSGQSAARAEAAGLTDAGTAKAIAERAAVIVSVCPPHAAIEVARSVAGFGGLYLDANAVSPHTASQVSEIITAAGGSYVDGGIIGPPPEAAGSTRLYLSGAAADEVRALFDGTPLDARIAGASPWSASAVKMAYASWTKGSAALLLAARELAAAEGVRDVLDAEWELSQPGLSARHHAAEMSAASKGWRWTAEMTEIAATMGAAGLPEGFHEAAAEMFARFPRRRNSSKLTGPPSSMRPPRAS